MRSSSVLAVVSLVASVTAGVIPRADGACTDPAVRKEWRELSDAEKAEYIRAAKCIRALPKEQYAEIEAVRTRMDDLTYTHLSLDTQIHFVANFLPWHRWYVQLHEDLLRTQCGFKGTQPYWDWSIDADKVDMPNSPLFDPVTGFGGNGKHTGSNETGFGMCVVDGPFANTTVTLGMGWPDVNEHGNRPHCFTRDFNGGVGPDADGNQIIDKMQVSAYNSAVMNMIYGMDTYKDMSEMLEGLPHGQIHSVIFGDMGPVSSPNEPLFFLHHGNIDRAWAKWQGRNATRLADYSGSNNRNVTVPASINDTMPIMSLGDVAPIVKDYMDPLSGPLCYTYSNM